MFPALFFPAGDPATATLQSLATFALAFLRAADGLRGVRSLRRSHWAQGDARGRAAHDGAVDGRHRLAAGLCVDRRARAAAARAVPLRPGTSGWAASGAARCCSRRRTRRPASAHGTACFRSSARRSASFCRPASSSRSRNLERCSNFFAWGWRVPFLASAALVFVGPLRAAQVSTETPAFQRAMDNNERVRVPMLTVVQRAAAHARARVLRGDATFVVFYLMTVFTLSWARPSSAIRGRSFCAADDRRAVLRGHDSGLGARRRTGMAGRPMLIAAALGIIAFGLLFAPLFGSAATAWRDSCSCRIGLALMGLHLWAARHGAVRAVPDGGALHGRFARVQSRGHPRRLARAVHCDRAREQLRHRGRGLLSCPRQAS